MVERGLLGRYGPNHAADPIVTRFVTCSLCVILALPPLLTFVIRYPLWMTRRWKRDDNNRIVVDENFHPLLEFVAIKRKDNGEWAIPGVRPAFCASLPSCRLLSISPSRAWWMQASKCH